MKLQILPDVEAFAKAEYDVIRLKVIDKVSHLVGALLLTICLILVGFAVLTFGAAAAVFALAQCMPLWASCLIIGGVYLLLIICLILIGFAVLTFGAAAAVFALGQCLPLWASCLIVGAAYLLLIPILIIGSTVLFVNPIIRKLGGAKNEQELKYETIRAEGEAAVQRERMKAVQTVWATIRNLFVKKD